MALSKSLESDDNVDFAARMEVAMSAHAGTVRFCRSPKDRHPERWECRGATAHREDDKDNTGDDVPPTRTTGTCF